VVSALQFVDESGHEKRHSNSAGRAAETARAVSRVELRAIVAFVPIAVLGRRLVFPPPEASEDGLLALGGDLSSERLLLAYRSGIFPWYAEGLPILWHCPDPRCVLPVDRLHVGRTLRRTVAKRLYHVSFDRAFDGVITACKLTPRRGQDGTWITDEMADAYRELHRLGYAHSVEAWQGGELVGGLYGVSLGTMFFGESMFSWRPSASKVALVQLATRLAEWGFRLIDAQVANDNTLSMGAEQWPREQFLRALREALMHPTRRGSWDEGELKVEREGPPQG
jgi:leucyl/phenylalanyl-tRNA--protein transferase